MKISTYSILKSPLTLLFSTIGAILYGLYLPTQSAQLSEVGKIYIALIQLAVIPILTTSIILAISHFSSTKVQVSLKKGFLAYSAILILTSFLGIAFALQWNLGEAAANRPEINNILSSGNFTNAIEIKKEDPIERQTKTTVTNFVVNIFPSNALEALSKGYILQILTFSMLVGLALGRLKEQQRNPLTELIESFKSIFHKIIDWMILLLPLGIFFIISSQVATISPQTLIALGHFVLLTLIGFCVLIILGLFCIWRFNHSGLFQVFQALKEPALISFVTGSSVASMPSLIDNLIERLKFQKDTVNLFIPIGISICRHGNVFYYSFAAIFIAQMYHVPLFNTDYFIVILGSILAGIASASIGIVNLKTMSFILDPLGLPLDVVLVLFLAIDTLVLPLRTVASTVLNGASVAIVARSKNPQSQPLKDTSKLD